jgi:hypothetical protein
MTLTGARPNTWRTAERVAEESAKLAGPGTRQSHSAGLGADAALPLGMTPLQDASRLLGERPASLACHLARSVAPAARVQ